MISDEAVEAAAKAIYESESHYHKWDWAVSELDREEYRKHARTALEAAAPYMLAEAWSEGRSTGRTDPYCLDPNPYRSKA